MNNRAQVLVGMVTTVVFVTAGVVAFNSDREWVALVLLGLGFFRGSRVLSVIRRSREE
jgi:hypothetical protein